MPKIRGRDVYVEVNTGTAETPVWTKVGGATDASIDLTAETIDVTDKDTEGWVDRLDGIRSGEISSEHFLVDNDAGYQEIEDAYFAGTVLDLRFKVTSSKYLRGNFLVSKLGIKGPLKEAGSVSISFSLCGALTVATS